MAIRTLFSTPVYCKFLMNTGLIKFNRELKKQCYLIRDSDPDGVVWSANNYHQGYTSYGSITDLHLRFPHFSEFDRRLSRHLRKFRGFLEFDLQNGDLRMSSCWINIMSEGSAHSSHLHPLSVISGTYYVSVPRGSSALKFEDPRHSLMMAAPPKLESAKLANQTFVSIEPRAGQVALWESWLRHEVPRHRARADRISISFNFDWVPTKSMNEVDPRLARGGSQKDA